MSISKGGRRLVVAGAVLLVSAFGCTDAGTDPDAVVAISFDSLPSPGVVTGDTLRDVDGAAMVVKAYAYNGRGDVVASAPIGFITPDTGAVIITPDGYVIAKHDSSGTLVATAPRTTAIRLFANVGGLQSQSRTLDIVYRPDSLQRTDTAVTLTPVSPDTGRATNVSPILRVKLLHEPGDTAVKSLAIRFAIVYPAAAALGDTSVAMLVNEARAFSTVDTTDASGVAGRSVRVHPAKFAATDSVVVQASIQYRGAPVRGSPARMVVRIAP